MNLLVPLNLPEVSTKSVNLIPTKNFFKAVLVTASLLTPENADLLGCAYLFDKNGEPFPFEGAHHPAWRMAGGTIVLASTGSNFENKIEKVSNLSISQNDGKMELELRVHFPMMDSKPLADLIKLLGKVNKDKYGLLIAADQGSIFGAPVAVEGKSDPTEKYPQPSPEGIYDFSVCNARPFSSRKLKASAFVVEVAEESFLVGYRLDCSFANPLEVAKMPNDHDTVYGTHEKALKAAAGEIFDTARLRILTTNAAESKSYDELMAYLIDLNPTLGPVPLKAAGK